MTVGAHDIAEVNLGKVEEGFVSSGVQFNLTCVVWCNISFKWASIVHEVTWTHSFNIMMFIVPLSYSMGLGTE